MVARVVEKLGVVMGTKLPLNYEDDEFNYDKMSDEIKQDPEQMARGLMRAINRRNNRFDSGVGNIHERTCICQKSSNLCAIHTCFVSSGTLWLLLCDPCPVANHRKSHHH